jgi:hypothetical protein
MIQRWLLAGLFSLGLLAPANSAVLFAGAEDVDFTFVGSVGISTTAGQFRAGWGRAAISANHGSGTTNVPPTNYFETPTFTATSDFWVHFWRIANSGATNGGSNLLGLASPDGVWRLLVRGTGSTGQIKVSKRDAAATVTDLATSAASAVAGAVLQQWDIHYVYAVSGSIDVYVDGSNTAVVSFSGDTTTDAATQINRAFYGSLATATDDLSELIIADTDTRALGLVTFQPTSTGNAMAWSGATPCTTAILAQITINDANFIASLSNNDIAECAVSTTIPAGNWNALALVQSVRILRGTSGPQNFEFLTRVGGSDFPSGSFNPTTAFTNIGNYIQASNPAGGAWAPTDFTAAGFNIGLESLP